MTKHFLPLGSLDIASYREGFPQPSLACALGYRSCDIVSCVIKSVYLYLLVSRLSIHARSVYRPDGQKKAYVRLAPDYDALDVANKVI